MPNIVKITTMLNPLSLLAPHSCRGCGALGEPLCNRCKNYIISCRQDHPPKLKTPKNFPPTFVAAERYELMAQLISDFKYSSVRALGLPLAEIISQALPPISGPAIIAPLPTIPKHVRARGLDHTLLLAKKLAHLRGKNYQVQKLLTRANNTVQVGATAKTRKLQADAAYQPARHVQINPDATYILLDDVWTTGASMQAAVKKLRSLGARKIIVAILAVSRLD